MPQAPFASTPKYRGLNSRSHSRLRRAMPRARTPKLGTRLAAEGFDESQPQGHGTQSKKRRRREPAHRAHLQRKLVNVKLSLKRDLLRGRKNQAQATQSVPNCGLVQRQARGRGVKRGRLGERTGRGEVWKVGLDGNGRRINRWVEGRVHDGNPHEISRSFKPHQIGRNRQISCGGTGSVNATRISG